MPVSKLPETFGNQRAYSTRGSIKLVLQIEIAAESGPFENGRNFILSSKGLEIYKDIFDVLRFHAEDKRQTAFHMTSHKDQTIDHRPSTIDH